MRSLENERLHTVQNAAKLLDVSVSLIRKWLNAGRLTKLKAGNRTLVRERELIALIEPKPEAK